MSRFEKKSVASKRLVKKQILEKELSCLRTLLPTAKPSTSKLVVINEAVKYIEQLEQQVLLKWSIQQRLIEQQSINQRRQIQRLVISQAKLKKAQPKIIGKKWLQPHQFSDLNTTSGELPELTLLNLKNIFMQDAIQDAVRERRVSTEDRQTFKRCNELQDVRKSTSRAQIARRAICCQAAIVRSIWKSEHLAMGSSGGVSHHVTHMVAKFFHLTLMAAKIWRWTRILASSSTQIARVWSLCARRSRTARYRAMLSHDARRRWQFWSLAHISSRSELVNMEIGLARCCPDGRWCAES